MKELSFYIGTEEEKRERFYATVTEQEKAGFINGEIVHHFPVIRKHNQITAKLFTLLNVFVSVKGLGFIGFEKILIKLSRNDFKRNICFF